MRTSSYHEKDAEVRFWMHVHSSQNCWEWRGPIDGRGYGKFVVGQKQYIASRFSWALHYGPIASSAILVCHDCDNRICIRPDHLFLGTALDNLRDMSQKGRSCLGERNGMSSLKESDVRLIRDRRQAGESLRRIADDFDIAFQTVSLIALRKIWKHVA